MSDLKKQFGKRLQALRTERGMTQEQLAAEIGVTVESISNMERGIHGPSFEKLERIARALRVPEGDLFSFSGHPGTGC
jgi:transcriptional regulator with XRE-family HTH domain